MDLYDIEAALKKIESLGDIHLLVNNAGIAILGPFEEAKLDDFDKYVFMLMSLPFKEDLVIKNNNSNNWTGTISNIIENCLFLLKMLDYVLFLWHHLLSQIWAA